MPTGSSEAVTNSGHPPPVGTVQTWGIPVMFETKAIRFPSGEKLGEFAEAILDIRETVLSSSSAQHWAGE